MVKIATLLGLLWVACGCTEEQAKPSAKTEGVSVKFNMPRCHYTAAGAFECAMKRLSEAQRK